MEKLSQAKMSPIQWQWMLYDSPETLILPNKGASVDKDKEKER